MSTSLMYHTQGIVGFQHCSFTFQKNSVIEHIKRKTFHCPDCGSSHVTRQALYNRQVHGLSYGAKNLYFEFTVHRIYCLKCRSRRIEHFPFLSHPKSRISKALERTIIELRSEMSISAIARYFKINWRTVKNCERRHLKYKYRKIKLKHVKIIGIDEIFVSRRNGQEKYLTIVRDLESGAVLFVGDGKGVETLQEFSRWLKQSRCQIELIAMDMSKAFIAWAKEVLPQAEIVFDHFHVIKLMNEKLDQVRRRITAKLDDEQKKLLKNQRPVPEKCRKS